MKANLVLMAIILFAASLPIFGQTEVAVDVRVQQSNMQFFTEVLSKSVKTREGFTFTPKVTSNTQILTLWTSSYKVGTSVDIFSEVEVPTMKKAVAAQGIRIAGAVTAGVLQSTPSGSYGGYVIRSQAGNAIYNGTAQAADAIGGNGFRQQPVKIGHVTETKVTIYWQRTLNGKEVNQVTSFTKSFFVLSIMREGKIAGYALLPSLHASIKDAEMLETLDWKAELESRTFMASSWGQVAAAKK